MPFRHSDRPRRISRDYHRPRTGNPLFPRANRSYGRTPRVKRFEGRSLWLLAAIGTAGLIWYVIWGDALKIKNVVVNGAAAAAETAIRAGLTEYRNGKTLGIFSHDNELFFNRAAALKAVSGLVVLEQIEIRKRLPHGVTVDVTEKSTRAALDKNGRLFALDESGHVIRELTSVETGLLQTLPPGMDTVSSAGLGAEAVEMPVPAADVASSAPSNDSVGKDGREVGTLPLIRSTERPAAATSYPVGDASVTSDGSRPFEDSRPVALKPGDVGVSAAAMRLVMQAVTRLPDISGEKIRWYAVDPSSETVEGITESGWRILMSTALPFDTQGERLGIVLKEKIGNKRDKLEYVDLRYNERIFLRYKDGAQ